VEHQRSSWRTFLESPILVVFAICAAFCVLCAVERTGDGDLYWQRWLGTEILRSGRIPHALGPEVTSAVGAP
jgi:hypothetical protein